MDEKWKDVEGYEGRYQVSDAGRIKSFVTRHNIHSEQIRKQRKTNAGYLSINLTDKHGKISVYYVHRLVAQSFIGTIPPKHEVNHINGNKTDNRAANLEIVTSSQNQIHAFKHGLQKPTIIGKTVSAIKGESVIGTFNSISEMCRTLSLNRSNVWKVMKGKLSQHHGYTFMFNK